MRHVLGAIFALIFAASAAQAEKSIRQTLETFHFFGTWAPDCDRPASPANGVRTTSVTSEGQVKFIESLGENSEPNLYVVRTAKRIGSRSVVLRIELNGVTVQDLTMQRSGGQLRTMSNRRVADDKLLVKRGVVIGSRLKTPWLNRCRDAKNEK